MMSLEEQYAVSTKSWIAMNPMIMQMPNEEQEEKTAGVKAAP
jgi:hypothetical protein